MSSLSLLCLIFGDRNRLALIYSARVAVQELRGFYLSDSPVLELQTHTTMPSFSLDAVDPGSGPHAFC